MRLTTTLIILILFSSCRQNAVDMHVEGNKLMQLSRKWSQSAQTANVEKTLSYWADDAIIMSPGQPPIKGKDAIREMVEGTSKIPGFKISWEPLTVSVSKSGDMAYMIEQNKITMNDSSGNPVTGFNKVVTVWRKESGGSWKNVVDMWNSEPAPEK